MQTPQSPPKYIGEDDAGSSRSSAAATRITISNPPTVVQQPVQYIKPLSGPSFGGTDLSFHGKFRKREVYEVEFHYGQGEQMRIRQALTFVSSNVLRCTTPALPSDLLDVPVQARIHISINGVQAAESLAFW